MGAFANEKHQKNMGNFTQKKNRGWCSLLVMMLGNAFRVQCTIPNMESVAMLDERNRENSQKQRGMLFTVGDDVQGAVFRIQCAFPNMEGMAMPNEK